MKELYEIVEDATNEIENHRAAFAKQIETLAYLRHPEKAEMIRSDPLFRYVAFKIEKLASARSELMRYSHDFIQTSSIRLEVKNMEERLYGDGLISKAAHSLFLESLPKEVL